MIACTSCAAENTDGARFCSSCGASLRPPACRSCGAGLASGARFCTTCGTPVTPPETPGTVVDGAWHRAPGDLARRVPSDALRRAWEGLGVDVGPLLAGTLLGAALDTVLSRTVRVPLGSVGVVLRGGAVARVLPPGEQTTAGILREIEDVVRPGRSGLYLVDTRPIPLVFSKAAPIGGSITTLAAEVVATPGTRPEQLGALISDLLADRDAVGAEAVAARLREAAEKALDDAVRAGRDLAGIQAEAARALGPVGARLGMTLDVRVRVRDATRRLDLRLGGEAAATCGCGAPLGPGQRFCVRCGAAAPADAGSDAVVTADARSVELDVAVVVSLAQSGIDEGAVRKALATAARRALATRSLEEAGSEGGFAALRSALETAAREALPPLGGELVSLELLDLRASGEAWALGARAAIAKAVEEARVGREWLAAAGEERALEEATLAAAFAAERVRREHAFTVRAAQVADARKEAGFHEEERGIARSRAEADHTDALTDERRRREREREDATHRVSLETERRRQAAEDEAHADRLRREARLAELKGLADLEAAVSEREQRHRVETIARMEGRSEAEILALQATDLAKAEHGAAFADALGKLADGEAARRERERTDARLDARDERLARLAEAALGAATRAPKPGSCVHCGAALAAGAKFCGGCGRTV